MSLSRALRYDMVEHHTFPTCNTLLYKQGCFVSAGAPQPQRPSCTWPEGGRLGSHACGGGRLCSHACGGRALVDHAGSGQRSLQRPCAGPCCAYAGCLIGLVADLITLTYPQTL
jgi:hypothetical protein